MEFGNWVTYAKIQPRPSTSGYSLNVCGQQNSKSVALIVCLELMRVRWVRSPNCGVWTVMSAVVDSNVCSKPSQYRLTSVEVPPISKPMTGHRSPKSANVVYAYPTTPPAGPLSIDRHPLNLSTGVSPPSDCMNSTLRFLRPSLKPEAKPFIYRWICGVR